MPVFENLCFSKLFSSFREKSTKGTNFSRKMFSSFRVKSSTKPLLRKLSLRSKSSSKTIWSDFSEQQWKINPLYVSTNQVIWEYSNNDIEQLHVPSLKQNDSDLVKQTSTSSGVSSGSSCIYSPSSKCSISSSGSSSGVSSAVQDISSEHICSSNSELFENPYPKSMSNLNANNKSREYKNQLNIDNRTEIMDTTNSLTPIIPTTSAKLRLVRRRISNSSQSDADYEIHIDEYYSQDNSELLSGSSSGIPSDDTSPDNSCKDFYNDLVDDIRILLQLDKHQFTNILHIGFVESIH